MRSALHESADELVADAQLHRDSAHGPSAVPVSRLDRCGALRVGLSVGGCGSAVRGARVAKESTVVGFDHAGSLQRLTNRRALSTVVDTMSAATKETDMTTTAQHFAATIEDAIGLPAEWRDSDWSEEFVLTIDSTTVAVVNSRRWLEERVRELIIDAGDKYEHEREDYPSPEASIDRSELIRDMTTAVSCFAEVEVGGHVEVHMPDGDLWRLDVRAAEASQ